MSDPFAAPAADAAIDLDGAVVQLERMRPWQRFMGIGATIFAALLVAVLVLATIGSLISGNIAGIACSVPMYGILIWVYWTLGSALRESAEFIQKAADGDPEDVSTYVDLALRRQADFWQLIGVVTAVFLALYALLFALIIGVTLLGMSLDGALQ